MTEFYFDKFTTLHLTTMFILIIIVIQVSWVFGCTVTNTHVVYIAYIQAKVSKANVICSSCSPLQLCRYNLQTKDSIAEQVY